MRLNMAIVPVIFMMLARASLSQMVPMPPPQVPAANPPATAPATAQGKFPGYLGKSAEADQATPVLNMEDSYEGGRLIVRQTAEKPFSIHTGETLIYRMEVEVTPEVILDFAAVKEGILGLEKSDFRWFDDKRPDVKITACAKGKSTLWSLEMRMQTFQFSPVTKKSQPIPQRVLKHTVAFQYATEKLGGYPAWKRLVAKPYLFTWVPSVDANPSIIEGDLRAALVPSSPWSTAARVLGIFLVTLPVSYTLICLLGALARRREPTSPQQAWAKIVKTVESANNGLQSAHLRSIRSAVAFCVGSLSDTDEELVARLEDERRRRALSDCLTLMRRSCSAGEMGSLGRDEAERFLAQLKIVLDKR